MFFFVSTFTYINFICFVCMHVCGPHVCSAHGGQKRVLDPLGLKLQMAVSHYVGAGHWTGIHWKCSQSPNLGALWLQSLCSYLLISTKLASVQLSLGLITILNNLSLLWSNNSKWSFLPPNKNNTAEERKSSLIKTSTFLKRWHLEFTSNLDHRASKRTVICSRWMGFFWASSAVSHTRQPASLDRLFRDLCVPVLVLSCSFLTSIPVSSLTLCSLLRKKPWVPCPLYSPPQPG